MKKIAYCTFVKSASIESVKTRLANGVGKQVAVELYLHCINSLHYELNSINNDKIDFFWAVTDNYNKNSNEFKSFNFVDQGHGKIGDRLNYVAEQLRMVYDAVVFLASDSPALSRRIILKSYELLNVNDSVVGPSSDGGFYLLGLDSRFDFSTLKKIEYSKSTTLESIINNLANKVYKLETVTDIDEMKSLRTCLNELSELEYPNIFQEKIRLKIASILNEL